VSFWDSLESPWQVALTEAWTANCENSLPIGAVVTRDGVVIATGRNRIAEKYGIERYVAGNSLAHAELNALLQLPNDLDGQNVHVYTTLEPCPLCAGAIRMMHVANVHYAARAKGSGAAHLLKEHPYISRGVNVSPPQNPVLEKVSLTLLLHSYLVAEFGVSAVAAHETLFPEVVQVVLEAYDNSWLQRMVRARIGAEIVIDEIADKFVL
jgi:tRNA(adenine34) deaminase